MFNNHIDLWLLKEPLELKVFHDWKLIVIYGISHFAGRILLAEPPGKSQYI